MSTDDTPDGGPASTPASTPANGPASGPSAPTAPKTVPHAPGTANTTVTTKKVPLRFKVRARSGRGIAGATVSVAIGTATTPGTSAANGLVTIPVWQSDIDTNSGAITVTVKKFHHGPDPGPGGTVTPGPLTANLTVSASGFDPAATGVAKDSGGLYLDCVLIDGGLALAAATPGTPTRRLTDAQVQQELMSLQVAGTVTLDAGSDFVFEHDKTMGEFDACDPTKCKVKNPAIAKRVSLTNSAIGAVSFFYLATFNPSPHKATDKIPGQRFLRDTFSWAKIPLQALDQRHVVGLARLCAKLNSDSSVVAIFTQGVNGDTVRSDCHGYGMALDFAGVATALPDSSTHQPTVRLGVDFLVFLHWGRVPMWDATTIAANPGDPTQWKRQKGGGDDGFNYSTDPQGTTHPLHYRLDPAPFQDPVPPPPPSPDGGAPDSGAPASTAPKAPPDPVTPDPLASVATHFQTAGPLFQSVFDFAVAEYQDTNTTMGPLTGSAVDPGPTAIDDQSGHYVLHPDYGTPNAPGAKDGRQAHVNHVHLQVGPTHYGSTRTT